MVQAGALISRQVIG